MDAWHGNDEDGKDEIGIGRSFQQENRGRRP
jgi:hypothetical protein